MINVLSGLRLGRARYVTSWEEVLALFQPREWSMVSTETGRMAYTVLDGDRDTGRVLALVMMEDAQAPGVFMPTGSVLFTIRGQLTIQENGSEATMDTWDMVQMDNARNQRPRCSGLYLGAWAFPHGNPLLEMIRRRGR